MDALPIVVALDVREQVASRLIAGCSSSLMDELDPRLREGRLLRVWKKLSIGALS